MVETSIIVNNTVKQFDWYIFASCILKGTSFIGDRILYTMKYRRLKLPSNIFLVNAFSIFLADLSYGDLILWYSEIRQPTLSNGTAHDKENFNWARKKKFWTVRSDWSQFVHMATNQKGYNERTNIKE